MLVSSMFLPGGRTRRDPTLADTAVGKEILIHG